MDNITCLSVYRIKIVSDVKWGGKTAYWVWVSQMEDRESLLGCRRRFDDDNNGAAAVIESVDHIVNGKQSDTSAARGQSRKIDARSSRIEWDTIQETMLASR
ncbi:hypothetical protein CBL_05907 [Carabus blaptoides fortunei]